MSFLYLSSPALGVRYKLNCTSFFTTMFSQMSSVQTKTMVQHFPSKAQQPEVHFDLVFSSEREYEQFQRFVRAHQLAALYEWPSPEVRLWWPERDINNWSGVIKHFRAGGARFNPAPRVRLTVDLIDSVFSRQTDLASVASDWLSIAGYGTRDGILALPTLATNMAMAALGMELPAIAIGSGAGLGSLLRR